MLRNLYQKYSKEITWALLALICVLEFGLVSWWKPEREADANLIQSCLIFFTGIGMGIYAIRKSFQAAIEKSSYSNTAQAPIWVKILQYSLPFVGILILLPILSPLFEKYAIVPQNSDIIPQIEVMARRFMNGEFPYAPIHDFGYELRSPYMPLHWGPFVVPEAMGFDDRWWVISLWLFSSLFFTHIAIKKGRSIFQSSVLAIIPGLFIYLLLRNNFVVFSHTVELLILSYYIFLAVALTTGNTWLMGAALLTCLLSRYSLLFWTPLLFLPFLLKKPKSDLFKLGGLVLAGMLMLYVIPFLSKDWTMPFQGLEHHGIVTMKNWTFEPWFGPNGKPGALYRGTGLAALFYEFWPGGAEAQAGAVQNLQFIGSAALLILLSILYVRKREKIQDRLFLLGSLKLMLTFFYSFLALPIDYYFVVPVMLSLGILLYEGIDSGGENRLLT